MDKSLIKQAWAKYRPDSALPSPSSGVKPINPPPQPIKDRSDLNQVFGQAFIDKLLKGLKQRLYRGRMDFDYEEQKKRHKQMMEQQRKRMGRGKDEEDEHNVQFRNDFMVREILVDEDPLQKKYIPPEELQLVDDFLNKFIFIAVGGSTSKDQVDINLVLKALPARIDHNNVYRIDMIGFAIL